MEETKIDVPVDVPKSLDDVIAGLKGFGIEENEEILSFEASGRVVKLRISNIPTEQEMKALLAAEEFKGYTWVQRIRCEILSRAVTWVDGINIRQLSDDQRLVMDPTSLVRPCPLSDIQVVLRNILLGWGQEVLQTLWKILMVHSDKIEKRMQKDFPDSTLMTEVERRFFDAALKELQDANKSIIEDTMVAALNDELSPEEKEKIEGLKAKNADKTKKV